MFAKINHVAIVSEGFVQLARFYEDVFGMRTAGKPRPGRAVTVGDGHVGLNINPRREGRQARLDHFGIEVADVKAVLARLKQHYPEITWLERPGTRPFAALTTHDPAGNVFDLSQKDMANRAGVYAEAEWRQDRTVSHVAIRTLRADALAEFYAEVFELAPLNRAEGDPNHYLSDGRVTLELIPWDVRSSKGTSIIMPGMDHLGFRVESLAALTRDLEAVSANPQLRPMALGIGKEGEARLETFRATCPLGTFHMADPDGVLIDVAEA